MTSPFLSEQEIIQTTNRRTKPSQILALRRMGIEHIVRPDGSPLVSRSHVEKLLGGTVDQKQEKRIEPNWNALNGPQEKPGKQRSA